MDIIYKSETGRAFKIGSTDIPCDASLFFSLDDNVDEIRDLLRIFRSSESCLETPYSNMGSLLKFTDFEILRAMPPTARKDFLKEIIKEVKSLAQERESQDYIISYSKIREFLRSLRIPSLSKEIIGKILLRTSHEQVKNRIANFSSSSEKTVYSCSGTVTGRLTVKKGPNILTLPSEVRSAIKPRNKNSRILQIDLVAAEPHLALLVAGKHPPEDIYDHISKLVLDGRLNRSSAKLVTLSALYGQSSQNLAKQLPSSINARSVIRSTKEYFSSDNLRSRLEGEWKSGRFKNVLGRPIEVDAENRNLLVSYFLQSSIAELSILIFKNFCEKMNLIPYFVIHDALIFECPASLSDHLLSKTHELEFEGLKFRAKVTPLEHI